MREYPMHEAVRPQRILDLLTQAFSDLQSRRRIGQISAQTHAPIPAQMWRNTSFMREARHESDVASTESTELELAP